MFVAAASSEVVVRLLFSFEFEGKGKRDGTTQARLVAYSMSTGVILILYDTAKYVRSEGTVRKDSYDPDAIPSFQCNAELWCREINELVRLQLTSDAQRALLRRNSTTG